MSTFLAFNNDDVLTRIKRVVTTPRTLKVEKDNRHGNPTYSVYRSNGIFNTILTIKSGDQFIVLTDKFGLNEFSNVTRETLINYVSLILRIKLQLVKGGDHYPEDFRRFRECFAYNNSTILFKPNDKPDRTTTFQQIKEETTYLYEGWFVKLFYTSVPTLLVPRRYPIALLSSKRVCEFPTNPFSDGDLALERVSAGNGLYITPIPRMWGCPVRSDPYYPYEYHPHPPTEPSNAIACARFLFKRELVEAVFHPARVERMIATYGVEWVDV